MKKLVLDIGLNDVYGSSNEKYYKIWLGMLRRCYDKKQLIRHPTYKNIYVCDNWHTLSNFRDWFLQSNYKDGYVLDKDLYIPNSKVYSPKTCLFVPHNINMLINKQTSKGYQILSSGMYMAKISIDNKNISLGTYKTENEAHQVYIEFKANRYTEIADTYIDNEPKIYLGLYRHAEVLLNNDWRQTLP